MLFGVRLVTAALLPLACAAQSVTPKFLYKRGYKGECGSYSSVGCFHGGYVDPAQESPFVLAGQPTMVIMQRLRSCRKLRKNCERDKYVQKQICFRTVCNRDGCSAVPFVRNSELDGGGDRSRR